MKSNKTRLDYFKYSIFAIFMSIVTSCGGGSDSPDPVDPIIVDPVTNTDWDSLIWDQDNWQ